MIVYACEHLWRRDGWLGPAFVVVENGRIVRVDAEAPAGVATETVRGIVLPGMPNLHSHAFQRAMAGLAERASPDHENFWSWRETMYRFVERLDPDDIESIASELYVEMLEAGYTSVGEFHYLHHAPDGRPYDNPVETSERIVAASRRTGINLTLLPVLYAASGFDGAPLASAQRRFKSDAAWVVDAVERLRRGFPDLCVGVAPHSLRATPPAELEACVAGISRVDPSAPIHIHIAEQAAEVDACLQARGARPVEWLLGHTSVDARWCLVHATHVDDREIAALAASGAVAGFCPTTEANLGDGIAPACRSGAAGVRFGIGSDSHVSVSVAEELRWLEYAQRLTERRRNVLASEGAPSTGEHLYAGALTGGEQALACGGRADLIVLDPAHPVLAGRPLERVLDAFVFSNHGNAVRDVMVGGEWVVKDGRHREREAIRARYARTMARLDG